MLNSFSSFVASWQFWLFGVITMVVIEFFAEFTGMYRRPNGWHVGFLALMAFVLGAVAALAAI